jgi:hypothetical protein
VITTLFGWTTFLKRIDFIESVLGFKRQELIGRNVTQIIPRPIAKVHDKLV